MKLALALSTALTFCTFISPAAADPLTLAPGDTIAKLLTAQTGKVVTVKLGGGDELTGKVKSASDEVVHLSELSGKEFFDAAVSTDSITAVLVRTR